MRLSHFWQRMEEHFGAAYAESLSRDYVFEELGSRTIRQALDDGFDAKEVWHAVCQAFDLPAHASTEAGREHWSIEQRFGDGARLSLERLQSGPPLGAAADRGRPEAVHSGEHTSRVTGAA